MFPLRSRHGLLLVLSGCSEYALEHKGDVGGGETAACTDAAPAAYTVPVDETCAFPPVTGEFHPVVEWQWSVNAGAPGYDEVMMTPVVGDVDGDGLPDVVFTAYANPSYGSPGALMILAGDGSREEGAFLDLGGYAPNGSAGVALGDLNADGVVEIVTITYDNRLIVLHADGAVQWVSAPAPDQFGSYGYPSIADLDGDGLAEVVAGRGIYGADGTFLGAGGYGWGGAYAISVVVDLDGDGVQEVVAGNAAYRPDGSSLWYNGSVGDGYPAIGDFDGDGQGEVAVAANGSVSLLDTDGTLLWGPSTVPGGGSGPPTVADFDGDGALEIGVAGASSYAVFDTDGSLLWSSTTQDVSSAQTGSSVFDFEGDGASEAVYADELDLRVYDGAGGAVKLDEVNHSSWTLFEYPVVVDADGDGEAEIVLASNDSINGGWKGVTVIGDADGSWAPTSAVWNQHGYSITNVNDDLSIPAHPTPNWEVGHNSFRAGGLRDRTGNPAPNLRPVITELCWECETGSVHVAVQVENVGELDARGDVNVGLYARTSSGDVLVAGQTVHGVGSGDATEGLLFDVPAARLAGATDLVAVVDPEGALAECDESDNTVVTSVGGCP